MIICCRCISRCNCYYIIRINQQIRKENDIKTNSQYRQFLTENADSIVKANQLEACDNCCYCPAMRTGEPISNTPFLYTSCMEKSQPYGYEDSDLKNLYLSSYGFRRFYIL